MAIGRSFPEALQKALRSLERKEAIFSFPADKSKIDKNSLLNSMRTPTEYRLQQVQQALWAGSNVEEVFDATKIDRWYLEQIQLINQKAEELTQPGELTESLLFSAKQLGFSDIQIGNIRGISPAEVRAAR